MSHLSPLKELMSKGRMLTKLDESYPFAEPNKLRIRIEDGKLLIGPREVLEKLRMIEFVTQHKDAIMKEITEVEDIFKEFLDSWHSFRHAGVKGYYPCYLEEAEYCKNSFNKEGLRRIKEEMEEELGKILMRDKK